MKKTDLIILGVATDITLVHYPGARRDQLGIYNNARLEVQVEKVFFAATNKVANSISVDFGYNAALAMIQAYRDRRLIFVLRQMQWDTNGCVTVATPASSKYSWAFAHDPKDADRLLEIRNELQKIIPKNSSTNLTGGSHRIRGYQAPSSQMSLPTNIPPLISSLGCGR
ncbi:MAG: hypothetical protein HY360_18030 [Verrucomicrobia bacterium]|nr:hypothetical protein [Verrucomicrobiota bacterium]